MCASLASQSTRRQSPRCRPDDIYSVPIVKVGGGDHALIVPRPTAVPAAELRAIKDSLSAYQNEIVGALDLLFLGV